MSKRNDNKDNSSRPKGDDIRTNPDNDRLIKGDNPNLPVYRNPPPPPPKKNNDE